METAMKTMTDKKRGWGLLSLGLDAFAGLGLEVVYAFLLEPLLYGASMEGWNTWQTIVHWIITCISWGPVSYTHLDVYKRQGPFSLCLRNRQMHGGRARQHGKAGKKCSENR